MPTRPAREAFRHMETSGLAAAHPGEDHAGEGGHGGGKGGVAQDLGQLGGICGGGAVEAVPAEPEDEAPQRAHGQGVPGDGVDLDAAVLFRVYLPIRGPSIHAPIRAASPPTMWITEEPAKST